MKKKELTKMRKRAKKDGWKLEAKEGPDGKFHVYALKGETRRIIL